MQYKIPQNVGIEDKIVGPLTLRQLIMLAIGFGISYVLFALLNKIYELNVIEYIVIMTPGLISVAFALVKVNDIPLLKYILLFLEFSIKPKKRVWDHRGISALVSPDIMESPATDDSLSKQAELDKKSKRAKNLKELTKMLDSGGFEHVKDVEHKDIDVIRDDDLVAQAYFGHKKKESPTENMYWRTKDSQMKRLEILASLPITKLKKGTKETAIAREQILKAKDEAERQKMNPEPKNAAMATPSNTPQKTFNAKPGAQIQPRPKTPPSVINTNAQSDIQRKQPSVKTPIQKVNKPVAQNSGLTANNMKKNRKRNRPAPQPVRKNSIVNTTNKNSPAKYIDKHNADRKNDTAKALPPKQPQIPQKGGEFDFRELEKGEIEINLD